LANAAVIPETKIRKRPGANAIKIDIGARRLRSDKIHKLARYYPRSLAAAVSLIPHSILLFFLICLA